MTQFFTVDQQEALSEIANIAMGRASRALATLLDRFVDLSVPEIFVVEAAHVERLLKDELGDAGDDLAVVRQSFYGGLYGEVITIHSGGAVEDLIDLLGYEGDDEVVRSREFLLDVGNLLGGAVLNGIAEMLDIEVGYSAPSLIEASDSIVPQSEIAWTQALLAQIRFRLEELRFSSRLLVFLPDRSFGSIRHALDTFLEEL